MITKEATLSLPSDRILSRIALAYNATYLLLAISLQSQDYILLHYDSKSSLIKQYKLNTSYSDMFLLNSQQVLLPMLFQQKFVLINLREQSQRLINFNFKHHHDNVMQFYLFPEADLFCLKQSSFNIWDTCKTHLSYFKIKDFDGNAVLRESMCRMEMSQPEIYRRVCFVTQVSYFQPMHHLRYAKQENKLIRLEEKKGVYSLKKIDFPIECNYSFVCWQVIRGELAILPRFYDAVKPISIVNLHDNSIKHQVYPILETNNRSCFLFLKDFILDYELKINEVTGQVQGYDSRYYIDVEDGSVVLKDPIDGSEIFTFPGNGRAETYPNQLFQFRSLNSSSIKVRSTTFYRKKQIYLQMLLHINENFDDNLLLDCQNLLSPKE